MNLEDKVNKWFTDKDLQHAPIEGQLDKLQEEVDELKIAYKEMDIPEIIDAIGDTEVVLHGICLQLKEQHSIEVTPTSALESAYDVIKNRTGKYNPVTKMWEKDN